MKKDSSKQQTYLPVEPLGAPGTLKPRKTTCYNTGIAQGKELVSDDIFHQQNIYFLSRGKGFFFFFFFFFLQTNDKNLKASFTQGMTQTSSHFDCRIEIIVYLPFSIPLTLLQCCTKLYFDNFGCINGITG